MKRSAPYYEESGGVGGPLSTVPSHKYLNLSIINGDAGTNGLSAPQRVAFTESRSSPIIEHTGQYEMSVTSATINGIAPTLPLWIPQILTGPTQMDVNLTIYELAVVTAGGTFKVALQWLPYFTDPAIAPRPVSPVIQQDVSSAYYFAKSYTQFCDMFNTALFAVIEAAGGAASLPTGGLSYNPTSASPWRLNLPYSFNYEFVAGSTDIVPPTTWLQLNPPLNDLLFSFPTAYGPLEVPFGNVPLGFEPTFYTLIPPTSGPTVGLPGTNTGLAIGADNDPTTSGLWNAISAFVFTSNLLPVVSELRNPPTVLGQSNARPGNTGQGFTPIIAEIPIVGGPYNALQSIAYTPTAEYHVISLSAGGSIQQIDVNLFWRYRVTGQLVPVSLPNNASINMKILFRQKSWNASM